MIVEENCQTLKQERRKVLTLLQANGTTATAV